MNIAVIGDLNGNPDLLEQSLGALGVEVAHIPDTLNIIQLGNLVNLGETGNDLDNLAVLERVTELVDANPGRFTPIWGEQDLLATGQRRSPGGHPKSVVTFPHYEHLSEHMRHVVSVEAPIGPTLLSHRGLSVRVVNHYGSMEPTQLAHSLNQLFSIEPLAGVDGVPSHGSGRSLSCDLYGPWISSGNMWFHQIHANSSPLNWDTGRYHQDTPRSVSTRTIVNPTNRWTLTTTPSGHGFTSYALGKPHGLMPASYQPTMIHDALVAS